MSGHSHVGGYPRARPHVQRALRVDPPRPGQTGDEQARRRPPARHGIEDRGGQPRPVHEHRPARLVRDTGGEVVRARVIADLLAELRVLVEPPAAGVTIDVERLLQRERHLRDPRQLVADALAVGLEVLFAAPRAAVGEEPETSASVMDSRAAPSMPASCIFAARFATVALLHRSKRAASFQLTPLSNCAIISFLVAMEGLLSVVGAARMAAPPRRRLLREGRYRVRGIAVLSKRNDGTI